MNTALAARRLQLAPCRQQQATGTWVLRVLARCLVARCGDWGTVMCRSAFCAQKVALQGSQVNDEG